MVFIDYRKLISFSKGSFIVTLPKSWVENNSLKKGDMLGVEEDSNSLTIYAKEKESEKKDKTISINAEGKSLGMIKAEVVSSYLNNYNTIEIFSKTLGENAPVIKEIIRNLSGMEIIEQTGSRIVAKDLIDINSVSIQSIIRRMDVITRSMIDDTIGCIEGKCSPAAILHRDVEVNRLYYLGFRVIKNAMEAPMLMKKLNTNPWKLHSDKQVMARIEEIADRQKRISRLMASAGFKDDALEEFKKIMEELRDRYHGCMKAYYNNDKKLAFEIEVTHKPIIERYDNFLEDTAKKISMYAGKGSEAHSLPKTSMVPAAKIIEYSKACATFARYISRVVLNLD